MARNPKPLRRLEKRFFYSRKNGLKIKSIQKAIDCLSLKYYILLHRKPYPVNFFYWGIWYGDPRRRIVKQTELPGGVRVSTVFLGMDHGYKTAGPPLIFETMIFGGDWDKFQARYYTYDEALKGHDMAVNLSFEVRP